MPNSATSDPSPPASIVGRRKPHTKSRTGCSECRRRRIKCGEQKPSCQSCARRETRCLYPDAPRSGAHTTTPANASPGSGRFSTCPTAERHANVQAPARASSSHPGPVLSDPSGSAATFAMDDMVLLHHWSLHTSREIVKSVHVDYCWQTVFPRIGFEHEFVMHGILSLAALHAAHTEPSRRQRRTLDAFRHHNTSLEGFRKAISEMRDQDSDALFACAVLNIIYTFATMGPGNDDAGDNSLARSRTARALGCEWIPMIRGVQAILGSVYDRVRTGPLGPLTDLGNWQDLGAEGIALADDEHLQRIAHTWSQSADSQIYDETRQVLRKCWLYIDQFATMDDESLQQWGYNRGWAGPGIFLHFAPAAFFDRLQQRQPPALVIFAHLGVLLHRLDDFWFLEGWGRRIVQVTDELLGDYWDSEMEWPRRVVGLA